MSANNKSYVDNYKYGCFLSNHSGISVDFKSHAVPFFTEHYGHEKVNLPTTNEKYAAIRISKYCHCLKRTQNKTKIYELPQDKYNDLLHKLTLDIHVKSLHHVILNAKDASINKYIVKVVQVKNWQDAYTAMKELYMTDEIYKSSHLSCNGSDIACKPFFGCMFWSGKRWKYLSVYEKANGFTLAKINRTKFLNRKYNKDTVMVAVSNAIQTLWMLGFAHNDLYDANIIYDFKNKKVKIIDYEMTVKLPENITATISSLLYKKKAETVKITKAYCDSIARIYEQNAKEMAISILSLAQGTCYVNTDEDGFIYNTDENLLPMLYEML